MRCFGKGYEEFYHRLLEEEVRFIRGRAASVSDTASGRPTGLRGLLHQSPARTRDEWARDNGALMRAALENAQATLAGRIVARDLLGACCDHDDQKDAIAVVVPEYSVHLHPFVRKGFELGEGER